MFSKKNNFYAHWWIAPTFTVTLILSLCAFPIGFINPPLFSYTAAWILGSILGGVTLICGSIMIFTPYQVFGVVYLSGIGIEWKLFSKTKKLVIWEEIEKVLVDSSGGIGGSQSFEIITKDDKLSFNGKVKLYRAMMQMCPYPQKELFKNPTVQAGVDRYSRTTN